MYVPICIQQKYNHINIHTYIYVYICIYAIFLSAAIVNVTFNELVKKRKVDTNFFPFLTFHVVFFYILLQYNLGKYKYPPTRGSLAT
jgi:hypothetical protein